MLKLVFICLAFLAMGCATMTTTVHNDPTAGGPSGKRVSLMSVNKDGDEIRNPITGIVADEAIKWLTQKGYTFERNERKSHSSVAFHFGSKKKTIHVPAQTRSIPTYEDKSSTTTSTLTDNYGNRINIDSKTTPGNPYGPSGYRTEYVGAHDREVIAEALGLSIYRKEHGISPIQIAQGLAKFDTYDESLFGKEANVRKAVRSLLEKSALNLPSTTVSSLSDSQDPGCWPRIGIEFDDKGKVTGFTKESEAQKVGVRLGDIVTSLGGAEPNSPTRGIASDKEMVPVEYLRDGKKHAAQIQAKMTCLGQ